MMDMHVWAEKWGIPKEALEELQGAMNALPRSKSPGAEISESVVQSRVRLAAARQGWPLWRNNVGVLKDEKGRPVRYGLANESAKVNRDLKSHDLIGIRPVEITSDMVGGHIGQFVSLEVKKPGWNYTGTPREKAQLKWAQVVWANGGDARFITGEEQL